MRYIIGSIFTFLVLTCALTTVDAQEERKYVRKGVEYLEKENYSEAEKAFKEALKIAPSSFEAGYNLATAMFRQERYDEAMTQLQASEPFAASNKQKLSQLYHNLGNSFLHAQDMPQKMKMFLSNIPLEEIRHYAPK